MTAGQLRAELGLDAPRSISQCALVLPGDSKAWRAWIRQHVKKRRVLLPNGKESSFYTLRDVYTAMDRVGVTTATDAPAPTARLPRARLGRRA